MGKKIIKNEVDNKKKQSDDRSKGTGRTVDTPPRFMMAPGNFEFGLDKFSIFQMQRLSSTHIHSIPNIVHGPIVVAIEGVVSCNSFLNKPINTLSWLEL